MKYVSSLPPLAEVPDAVEIRELRHTQPVQAVSARLFPAHIVEHYPHREVIAEQSEPLEEEKRSDEERRLFCRRTEPAEPLLETRSSVERRRKNRRLCDTATSVDEEV